MSRHARTYSLALFWMRHVRSWHHLSSLRNAFAEITSPNVPASGENGSAGLYFSARQSSFPDNIDRIFAAWSAELANESSAIWRFCAAFALTVQTPQITPAAHSIAANVAKKVFTLANRIQIRSLRKRRTTKRAVGADLTTGTISPQLRSNPFA